MAPKKVMKDKNKNHTHSQDISGNKAVTWTIVLAFVLMTSLLFRGSFFPSDYYRVQIAITFLFILWAFKSTLSGQKLELFKDGYSLILTAFIISYIMPLLFFQWVNLDQTITMILWYATLFLMYWLVKTITNEKGATALFLDLWIIAGIVIATIGLVSLAGYGELQDAVMGNRIASTLQYPNTLAAFLMALFFISCGKMLKAERIHQKMLYAGAGWWMMLIFILTYSRAAWLIFPIMAAGYWVLIPKKDKLPLLFYDTITAVTLLIALQPIVRLTPAPEETEPRMLLTALAGMGVAVLLFWVVQKAVDLLRDRFEKVAYGVFALTAIVAIGFMVMAYNITEPLQFENTGEEPFTQSIQRTLEGVYPGDYQLNLQLEAQGGEEGQWPWLVRVDAVNEDGERQMLFQHPAQPEETGEFTFDFQVPDETAGLVVYFRNHFPNTKVTFLEASIAATDSDWRHEIPLSYKYIPEALVARFEAIDLDDTSSSTRFAYYRDSLEMFKTRPLLGAGGGAWESLYRQYQTEPYTSRLTHNFFLQTIVETGILGIVVLILWLILLGISLFQSVKEKNILGISIVTALGVFLIHSFLDINLSFFSMAIFVWSLMALLPQSNLTIQHKVNRITKLKVPAFIMLVIITPVLIFGSMRLFALQNNASAAQALQNNDVNQGLDDYERSVFLNPFNPNTRADYANVLMNIAFQTGDASFVEMAEENIQKGQRYSKYDDRLKTLQLTSYIARDQVESVLETATLRVAAQPLNIAVYESNMDLLNQYMVTLLGRDDRVSASKVQSFNVSHVDLLLEANQEATVPAKPTGMFRNLLTQAEASRYALEHGVKSEQIREGFTFASFPILEHRLGTERMWRTWNSDEGELTTDLTEKGLEVSNTGEAYGIAYTPNINLEPSTTYRVVTLFSDASMSSQIPVRVMSPDSEENRVQIAVTHDFSNDGLVTIYDFTTTEDIEPGRQYVRWDHPGNDNGSYTIKGVYIIKIDDSEE